MAKKAKQLRSSCWDGRPDHLVKVLTLQGIDKIDNIEGISPLVMGGKEYILLLGDNGDSETQEPAKFCYLSMRKF